MEPLQKLLNYFIPKFHYFHVFAITNASKKKKFLKCQIIFQGDDEFQYSTQDWVTATQYRQQKSAWT